MTPDGDYVGIYSGDTPIAFYVNHINLTFFTGETQSFVIDNENPVFGDSVCGVVWTAYTFSDENPIQILVHNPHSFGNETAIDELLENTAFWTGIEFENGVSQRDESQIYVGLFFMIFSLLFLGTALFSILIHIKSSRIIWVLGLVIFFAATYFIYSVDSISLRSESIIFNTTILGCSMILYMLFLSRALVYFMKGTKVVAGITVAILGVFDATVFVLPVLTNVFFYDLLLYWVAAQMLVNLILLGCLIREFLYTAGRERWVYIGSILPLLSFGVDVIMIDIGVWKVGLASKYIFIIFFVAAMVAVLKIIPNSINALSKAKELETEKIVLNAQLTESRVSTMMSQIRPHFIYNTLGSIEQLCILDPPKAGELVHNFAKYLRGNFRELDNSKPILMSQEMEHVRHYLSIENVRFPDMTFSFQMNSDDFFIPALTVQPIVENSIKHGLMKLKSGGMIRVVSYEKEDMQ